MSDVPRKWAVSGASGLPSLPDELQNGKLWVKLDGTELHSVCALDQDEGWIEMIVSDYKDGRAVRVLHRGDVVRLRLSGHVEQGVR